MEYLQQENEELKRSVESILEEIQQQKQLNHQHQVEIQTLLKFNQRLLLIIENQINHKKDSMTLHPISERSQRQSDLIGTAMNSLIKSKRIAARSQRGPSSSMVAKGVNIPLPSRDYRKSEMDAGSQGYQELSEQKIEQKTAYPILKSSPKIDNSDKVSGLSKAVENSVAVKQQMTREINELKKFKTESLKFYDKKIGEIKGLSSKVNSYKPMQQLKAISDKLSLSENTTNLIKKAIEHKK